MAALRPGVQHADLGQQPRQRKTKLASGARVIVPWSDQVVSLMRHATRSFGRVEIAHPHTHPKATGTAPS